MVMENDVYMYGKVKYKYIIICKRWIKTEGGFDEFIYQSSNEN